MNCNQTKKNIMKRILLLILVLGLHACKHAEMEDVFGKTPEERAEEQITKFRNNLMSSEMGWLSTYAFNEGQEELVLIIKFIDENRAEITAPELNNYTEESSYSLKYSQQIDLVFDTHGFFSSLVDMGLKADFRWELQSTESEKFYFKSRANATEGASELSLEKASENGLQMALQTQKFKLKMRPNPDISHFRVLELSSGERFDYSFVNNKVIFKGLNEGEIVHFESAVNIHENAFTLATAFEINGKRISEFEYDEASMSFKIVNAEGVTGGIYFSRSPAIIPQGIEEFWDQYLLFTPELNSPYCSNKWNELHSTIEESGYAIERMEFDASIGAMWLQVNGMGVAFQMEQKMANGRIYFKFMGANFQDEELFHALMPLLEFMCAPNGHFFIYEGKYEQYPNKTYSFVPFDYPNIRLYMIKL